MPCGSLVVCSVVVERRHATSAWTKPILYMKLLSSRYFLSNLAYILVSTAGVVISPMFYALELFALASRVKIFYEVILAVTSNPTRLLSTVVLGIITLWTFMLLGVAFFYGKYNLGDSDSWSVVCKDFSTCFGYVKCLARLCVTVPLV